MNQFKCSLAKAAAAILLAVVGFTLVPAMIDPAASQASDPHGGASHSWVVDAFPTGQATFAHSVVRGD